MLYLGRRVNGFTYFSWHLPRKTIIVPFLSVVTAATGRPLQRFISWLSSRKNGKYQTHVYSYSVPAAAACVAKALGQNRKNIILIQAASDLQLIHLACLICNANASLAQKERGNERESCTACLLGKLFVACPQAWDLV